MKKKKSDGPGKPAETLGEFFDRQLEAAKESVTANVQVREYLLKVVGEFGQLTAEVARKVDETLAAIDKEMKGRPPGHPTAEACRLKGEAQAYAFIAERISAMVKRLEEENETVH